MCQQHLVAAQQGDGLVITFAPSDVVVTFDQLRNALEQMIDARRRVQLCQEGVRRFGFVALRADRQQCEHACGKDDAGLCQPHGNDHRDVHQKGVDFLTAFVQRFQNRVGRSLNVLLEHQRRCALCQRQRVGGLQTDESFRVVDQRFVFTQVQQQSPTDR